jgi:imidazolonepropionase
VVTTHLAAHAIPPEYKGRQAAYIAEVAIPSLRAAQAEGLVDAVDAFCEGIAFSPDELAPLFAEARAPWPAGQAACRAADRPAGRRLRRPPRRALGDHLEYLSPDGIAALAAAGTSR